MQALVEDTLDTFDDRPTSANLRRCLRIASLRGDYRNQLWLELESRDIEANDPAEVTARRVEVLSGLSRPDAEQISEQTINSYFKRRAGTIANSGKILAGSVEQLEGRVRHLNQQADNFRTPTGLTPIDLGLRLDSDNKARSELHSAANETEQILQRVSARLHRGIVKTCG